MVEVSLSVSYLSDRALQPGPAARAREWPWPFSILPLGSCSATRSRGSASSETSRLSVSYLSDRALQPGPDRGSTPASSHLSVSYLSDRALQLHLPRLEPCKRVLFQYPTSRIVLCNYERRKPEILDVWPFSILPLGSCSATRQRTGRNPASSSAFSILPLGSCSATGAES